MVVVKINKEKPCSCENCTWQNWIIEWDKYQCYITRWLLDPWESYDTMEECYEHCPLEEVEN
jgi:hypothetical protein